MGLREYARHRARLGLPGGTLRAVQVAIRDGRLARSLAADGKKIASAKRADAEWAATTKADMVPLTGPKAPKRASAALVAKRADGPDAPEAEAPVVNDLAVARARREAAAARLAELELAAREGQLVDARDLEAKLSDLVLRCRTRLLGVAARLREQDPTLRHDQLHLVEALIAEALEELAGGDVPGAA
jgi:hypothetical protein